MEKSGRKKFPRNVGPFDFVEIFRGHEVEMLHSPILRMEHAGIDERFSPVTGVAEIERYRSGKIPEHFEGNLLKAFGFKPFESEGEHAGIIRIRQEWKSRFSR